MSRHITYIILIALLLSSCEKDIEVKTPPYKPLLVVNSTNEVAKSINVTVSKSIGILDYNGQQSLSVPDAAVSLYVNNAFVETLKRRTDLFGNPFYQSDNIVFPDNEYKIVVSAAGFDNAEATARVPSSISFEVQHNINVRTGNNGMSQDEIKLTFKDPPTDSDFYLINLISSYAQDTTSNEFSSGGCIFSSDPSIGSFSDFSFGENECISTEDLFISDELFNGTTKTLRMFVDSYWGFTHTNIYGQTFYAKIELYHISPSHFRYLKTYQYASDNSGNPFAEPINVYSNIKNGYGIFTISGVESKSIR